MTQRTASYVLGGGFDLVTPAMRKPGGAAIDGFNFEPRPEGYRRLSGFERYDGHALATSASYWVLNFDAGTAEIAEGQTVTGGTSGATGEALIAAVVQSGSYGAGTAAGYLVLTGVSGTFQDNEALRVSGSQKSTANGTATSRGATTDANDATWLHDAIETQRAKASAITGSGAIRGIWALGGTVYAFRDNAGGTACVMHKATASGWSACALGSRLKFATGTGEITAGQTVTGVTSGASAVVTRVVVRTGDWGSSDAEGQLIFASITGGPFQGGENLQVGGVTKAVANGASAAITLLPGGKFEFCNHNFTGATSGARMYGCDGVNPAFEWDGTVFVPLLTGMTTDTPKHIAAHRDYLFLSFTGGSVQFSSLGNPYAWEVLIGAGEFGMGEEVTALLSGYSGILVITTTNRIGILYGTVFSGAAADAELKIISEETGALEWSVQHLVEPVFMDAQGVRSLSAVQNYGNFSKGTLSGLIRPYIEAKRRNGASVLCSLRVRSLSQYRVFFSDGTGLILDMRGQQPAFFPINYGKVVRCASSVDASDGSEVLLFGSDDGHVYRADSGTSFDGSSVSALIRLAFNTVQSPTVNKRFHKATMEIDATPAASIKFTSDYSYGDQEAPFGIEQEFSVYGDGGFWDEDTWEEFYWSSVVGIAEAHLDGVGTNVSFAISSQTTDEMPYTLHGMTLHYSLRGLKR